MWLTPVAAGTTPVDSAFNTFLQYGLAGAVLVLALVALWALYRYQVASADRERQAIADAASRERADFQAQIETLKDERNRVMEELLRVNSAVQTQTMGSLTEATRAVTDAMGENARLRLEIENLRLQAVRRVGDANT